MNTLVVCLGILPVVASTTYALCYTVDTLVQTIFTMYRSRDESY